MSFLQRTQSESLTDLSCTPEEEEDDEKEMHADLPDAVFKTSDQEEHKSNITNIVFGTKGYQSLFKHG